MNRKTFVITLTAAIAGLSIPLIVHLKRVAGLNKPLIQPLFLMNYLDKKDLVQLGLAYREKVVAENNEQRLKAALLSDSIENKGKDAKTDELFRMLERQSRADFANGHTVIIDGWVVSVTEARQCALYSMNPD